MSGPQADILPGNALPLRNIPAGHDRCTTSSCSPARAAQLCRSAGTHGAAAGQGRRARATSSSPRARSGWSSSTCMATIGQVGNLDHENVSIGKAGRCRWHGIPADGARHRDEPRRPPDGRRRGQGQGQPPDDAVGQADQGLQDAARRAARRTATSCTPPDEVGARRWDARSKKGPYIDAHAARERIEELNALAAEEGAQDLVAALDDHARSSSGTRWPCTTARSSSRSTSPRTWSGTGSASSRRRGRSGRTARTPRRLDVADGEVLSAMLTQGHRALHPGVASQGAAGAGPDPRQDRGGGAGDPRSTRRRRRPGSSRRCCARPIANAEHNHQVRNLDDLRVVKAVADGGPVAEAGPAAGDGPRVLHQAPDEPHHASSPEPTAGAGAARTRPPDRRGGGAARRRGRRPPPAKDDEESVHGPEDASDRVPAGHDADVELALVRHQGLRRRCCTRTSRSAATSRTRSTTRASRGSTSSARPTGRGSPIYTARPGHHHRPQGRRGREAQERAAGADGQGDLPQHRGGGPSRARRAARGRERRAPAPEARRVPAGDEEGGAPRRCGWAPTASGSPAPAGWAAPRSRAASGTATGGCRCTRSGPTSTTGSPTAHTTYGDHRREGLDLQGRGAPRRAGGRAEA